MTATALETLNDLIGLARNAGATAADALLVGATDLSVSVRLGEVEHVERAESADIGLRVFLGQRQAIVSTTDRSPKALSELAERAIAMARLAPEDPYCGLAQSGEIATRLPQLELADSVSYTAEDLIARAKETEDSARSVKGITNSEGASAGWGLSEATVAASNGFTGTIRRSGYSLGASVIAGEGTAMERDYEHASRVFAGDLPAPRWIGTQAAERAVRRLNPRKMPTAKVPVFFDPRIAGGLIATLIGAISGSAVARGTSFLKDKLGKKVFSDSITIVDDPSHPRGLRSRPFDVEGLLPEKRKLIDQGLLTTWILDLRSARQLKMRSTGHAVRAPGGTPAPSPTNVYVEAGKLSPAEMMRDVAEGFYVTETMGMGVNGVTGDYSEAAAGFWIEKGEIVFPVNEMTIAGNLKDMFLNLSAASDLKFQYGVDAPTLRVDGMTIAGT